MNDLRDKIKGLTYSMYNLNKSLVTKQINETEENFLKLFFSLKLHIKCRKKLEFLSNIVQLTITSTDMAKIQSL
jgi:hypothetical protein